MISFHPDGARLKVVCRRRHRGWVIEDQERVDVSVTTRLYATWTQEVRSGWRPIGLNQVRGKVYPTRRLAALALVSDHKFEMLGNHKSEVRA